MKRPLFAALSVLICTGVSAAQPVTPQNFTRAETDRYFADIQQKAAAQAGHGSGINQFFYIRTIPKAGDRTIVRMNNDTLYGGVVVDTRGGATLTIPKMPDGRYASALILDNDHYAPEVFYTPGMHKLPERTRYLMVAIRIQVFDPKDEAEIKMVNGLQDKFKVNAHSSVPFKSPGWDQNQLNMQRKAFEEQFSRFQRYPDDWQGPRGKVNEIHVLMLPRVRGACSPIKMQPISITMHTCPLINAIRRHTRFHLIRHSGQLPCMTRKVLLIAQTLS